jgi:uncharacterized protein YkwD
MTTMSPTNASTVDSIAVDTDIAVADTVEPRSRRGLAGTVLTALAVLVALLAGLLAPAAAQASTPTVTKAEWSMAVALEKTLNAERKAHHLPALSMRTALLHSARSHNLAMSRANTMSHQLPGEPALGTRVTSAGYKWHYAGENIGWNSIMTNTGVQQLEKIMYAEVPPNNGHKLNILNTHYTNLGVDVYLDKTHHKIWLTVDFGRP